MFSIYKLKFLAMAFIYIRFFFSCAYLFRCIATVLSHLVLSSAFEEVKLTFLFTWGSSFLLPFQVFSHSASKSSAHVRTHMETSSVTKQLFTLEDESPDCALKERGPGCVEAPLADERCSQSLHPHPHLHPARFHRHTQHSVFSWNTPLKPILPINFIKAHKCYPIPTSLMF